MRRIRLCADDYGLAPGVNAAIRDLIAKRRLNATSAMVVGPALDPDAARDLRVIAEVQGAQIGLHLVFTAPFGPLTGRFKPLRSNAFLPLGATLGAALAGRFEPAALAAEAQAQIAAFEKTFGKLPDFVDGHQHVHLFPQFREAVLAVVKACVPGAWVRQCGRGHGAPRSDAKGLLIGRLSRRFRALAAAAGVPTNPAFAGTYRFEPTANFAATFPRFLKGLPDGGLVMCHPGFVDETLRRLAPLTMLREREYAYLAGPQFPADLAAAGVRLL